MSAEQNAVHRMLLIRKCGIKIMSLLALNCRLTNKNVPSEAKLWQLLYYFIPFLEGNKVEMTNPLNWQCHARMLRKITLPKKLIFSLNFSTDE